MKIYNETNKEAPCADFSRQFELANEHAEEHIFGVLNDISRDISDGSATSMGAIVVLGDFSQSKEPVAGLVQMKPKENPIQTFMLVNSEDGIDAITKYSQQPYDGAIVVDRTGQIIGAGVYLVVDYPTISIPDGCGTRHKAAASFSLRDDVVAVLTLSEETNTIRVWKDGKPERVV